MLKFHSQLVTFYSKIYFAFISKYFVFVTFYFAYDTITDTNKHNKVVFISWIVKAYSTVVTKPKGQNHSGNETSC